jgi:hypothetical protein
MLGRGSHVCAQAQRGDWLVEIQMQERPMLLDCGKPGREARQQLMRQSHTDGEEKQGPAPWRGISSKITEG